MNCYCDICKNKKPFDMPEQIIDAAIDGKLVFFCGAGVSTENRNVLPFTFYESIKNDISSCQPNIPFSQLMQKYCELPDGRRKLFKKIRDRFEYINSFPELERAATTFHKELAELYFVKTIVTTNWDQYFEKYCHAMPITIPDDFVYWDENERCVLKIHGSISNLSTIIATDDDYTKCKDSLDKGIIGSTLKYILAKNTVIFIGYSFDDSDFIQVMSFLHSELNEIMPHIFIVTLDQNLQSKIAFGKSTQIVTDGTFFVHKLKQILVDKKMIINTNSFATVEIFIEQLNQIHSNVSSISFEKYPSIIYTLAYQDGVIHALERYTCLYNSGNYNNPGLFYSTIRKYESYVKDYKKSSNYWDQSYYEGYLNGLMLVISCDESLDIVDGFPFFYMPDTEDDIVNYESLKEHLDRITDENGFYNKYAADFVNRIVGKNIVVHHRPC